MNRSRICVLCGKEFTPQFGSQKYCCEQCADTAKQNKKKQKREMFKAIEPMAMVQCQEYLTFANAAILMGCSRQYVYKLVGQGWLKASRLSQRMSLIKKSDIEGLHSRAKAHKIPMCKIAGKIYYSKRHIDEHFSGVDVSAITEWLITDEVASAYSMHPQAVRAYVNCHHI